MSSQGDEIGKAIVDAIVQGRLVHAECAESEAHGVVLTWSGNAYEQLEHLARGRLHRAASAFMARVGWDEDDSPGYPLDPETADDLRAMRAALRGSGEGESDAQPTP